MQKRRNKKAAARFFRRLIKGQSGEPRWLCTDQLKSYDAALREVMLDVAHINTVYANNRVEVSHQPTRQQEYHMRGFASSTQAQRFLTLHGLTQSLPYRSPPHAGGALSVTTHPVVSGMEGIRVCIS